MLTPSNRRPPREPRPQSPQFTLRVAMLGGVAVVLLTVIVFRLWVLQVLSSDRYRTEAVASQLRTVRVAAPRGRILDLHGRVLVGNRPGDAVTFDVAANTPLASRCAVVPPKPPPPPSPPSRAELSRLLKGLHGAARSRRRAEILAGYAPEPAATPWRGCAAGDVSITALASLTKTPIAKLEDRIHAASIRSPFEPVTLIDDAPRDLIFYLKEHGAAFPGIHVAKRTVRAYPFGTLAAHLFGQIGEVTADDLADPTAFPGAKGADVVGHSGIEKAYDAYLRGKNGTLNVDVNALGVPQGTATLLPGPVPGLDVRLTIDATLQAAAEKAIRRGIATAHSGTPPLARPMLRAARGALVVMDVDTGAIRAMASFPTFNPNRLVGAGSDAYAASLFKDTADAPLLDRAANGVYPPGSIFKPVTALAALETGVLRVDEPIHCGPYLIVDHQKYRNFETDTQTDLTLREAITRSCDTYFYEVGHRLYQRTTANGSFQPQPLWMRKLGFGRPTGLDIPDAAGVAPDAAYKKRLFPHDPINDRWTSGDAVNASIGQGYVQVTPLQIAALYALLANGGTLVTPHLGAEVSNAAGKVVRTLQFSPRRTLQIDADWLATIRSGLKGVTHDANGTAVRAFAGFAVGIAGKTGTAQKPPYDDYSWFAGYGPIGDPKLVAVCVIEQGGFGGVAAARAVRDVFAKAFHAGGHPGDPGFDPRGADGASIPVDDTQIANGLQFGDWTINGTSTTPGAP